MTLISSLLHTSRRKLSVKSMPLENWKDLYQKKNSSPKLEGKEQSSSQVSVKVDVSTRQVRKTGRAVDSDQPWAVLVHKKAQAGWVAYDPSTMRPAPLPENSNVFKLISWNVSGLQGLLAHKNKKKRVHEVKESLVWLSDFEDFDILCLQETRLQEKHVENIEKTILVGYTSKFWSCSTRKLGFYGSAIISRVRPLSVKYGLGDPVHDGEGRVITAEFDSFFLVAAYLPNPFSRQTYRTTKWDPAFHSYLKELERVKPVILAGDLNCLDQEIDAFNPDGKAFNPDGRASNLENIRKGLVDTFRRQHPNAVAYTCWAARWNSKRSNTGCRLDYFLASTSIAEQVHDSYTIPHLGGSDHCPIGLVLRLG